MKPWIQTYTGKAFWPLEPKLEDIDIEDIAHALSNICRFTGHCDQFYSVTEHSVRLSEILCHGGLDGQALEGLLHDASEAYLGDVARPLKGLMGQYGEMEQRVQAAIADKFSLPRRVCELVKSTDVVMLAWAARDLMDQRRWHEWDWAGMGYPEGPRGIGLRRIQPMEPRVAKSVFLEKFAAYGGIEKTK